MVVALACAASDSMPGLGLSTDKTGDIPGFKQVYTFGFGHMRPNNNLRIFGFSRESKALGNDFDQESPYEDPSKSRDSVKRLCSYDR